MDVKAKPSQAWSLRHTRAVSRAARQNFLLPQSLTFCRAQRRDSICTALPNQTSVSLPVKISGVRSTTSGDHAIPDRQHGRGCSGNERASNTTTRRRSLPARSPSSTNLSKANKRSLRSRFWPAFCPRETTSTCNSAFRSVTFRPCTEIQRRITNTKRV